MFGDLQIAIPSRSRANNQRTIYNLSENLWPNTAIIVPYQQYKEYRDAVPREILIIPFSKDVVGVEHQRQAVLDSRLVGKIIMMDDDLKFYIRLIDGSRFVPAYNDDTEYMVAEIVRQLDTYAMVGLTDKFMSQTKPRHFVECQRFNQVLGINRDLLPDPWPTFRLRHDEEHDFHLQLLTRGHKTAVLTEYTKMDKFNAPGGCSDWRSDKVMQETHARLMELWPGIVSITQKPEQPGKPKQPDRARYNWRLAKDMGGIR